MTHEHGGGYGHPGGFGWDSGPYDSSQPNPYSNSDDFSRQTLPPSGGNNAGKWIISGLIVLIALVAIAGGVLVALNARDSGTSEAAPESSTSSMPPESTTASSSSTTASASSTSRSSSSTKPSSSKKSSSSSSSSTSSAAAPTDNDKALATDVYNLVVDVYSGHDLEQRKDLDELAFDALDAVESGEAEFESTGYYDIASGGTPEQYWMCLRIPRENIDRWLKRWTDESDTSDISAFGVTTATSDDYVFASVVFE